MKEVVSFVAELARAVGAMQRENWGRQDLMTDTKSSIVDLVTEIDRRSEAMILQGLSEKFPDYDVLAEESGLLKTGSAYRWVIDPLDGTTNYAQGLPVFTVSIALQKQGETVLGVVYAPITDEMFTAVRGQGAYRNGQRLQVSGKADLITSVLATGFPYDIAAHPINNVDYFADLVVRTRALRRFGSAAYDLALVAAGRFDGHWEVNLSPWDVAAGWLLVEEAGGAVIRFREDRNVSFVAGNPVICQRIMERLRLVDEQRGK